MELIVLGAGGFMPDPGFPVPGFVVRHEGVNYLLDAGENSQTQMAKYGISRVKFTAVLISHMHGDHTLGLPGVLIRRGQEGGEKPLRLFGPSALQDYVSSTQKYLSYKLHYETEFVSLSESKSFTLQNLQLTTQPLIHRLEAHGFALQVSRNKRKFHPEKARSLEIPEGPLWGELQRGEVVELEDGRVIKPEQVSDPPPRGERLVYITDTRPLEEYPAEFQEPDLLIHEGMFLEAEREQAEKKFHSTALEAAQVAQKLNAKRLLLTHFSRRYDDPGVLAREAAKEFTEVGLAKPGMKIEID